MGPLRLPESDAITSKQAPSPPECGCEDVPAPDANPPIELGQPEQAPSPPATPVAVPAGKSPDEPAGPETRAATQPAGARPDVHWVKLCLCGLKYVCLVLTLSLCMHVPRWAVPRALGSSISSAQEFWDHCNRGDTSLENPHYDWFQAVFVIFFTLFFIPLFWIMPNDALPAVHGPQDPAEYAEARRRLGRLFPRQFWGGLYAALFLIAAALSFVGMIKLMDYEDVSALCTNIYMLAFLVVSIGIAHQAYALDAAWANTRPKMAFATLCIFAKFFVEQMLTLNAPRILDEHGDLALIALVLVANGIVMVAKQLTMRCGGDIGFLSLVNLGVGAGVSVGLRTYVFFKPSVGEAFVSSMLSATITLSGHIGNYFIFSRMQLHPRAVEAHEAILFTDQIYEVTSRVIAAVTLIVIDTKFYVVGKTGFGEQIDAGLVMVNFAISFTLHVLVTTVGLRLMYKASGTIDLQKFAESYKAWHAVLALAFLQCCTLFFAPTSRMACLRCLPPDHRDAYTCVDP